MKIAALLGYKRIANSLRVRYKEIKYAELKKYVMAIEGATAQLVDDVEFELRRLGTLIINEEGDVI